MNFQKRPLYYGLIFFFLSLLVFFDVVLFLLPSLVTGPSFMSISLLVLEFGQFSFTRDGPKNRKYPSEVCSISGNWGELEIPNLAQMFLMKCY